jgi:hypothetical protein
MKDEFLYDIVILDAIVLEAFVAAITCKKYLVRK